MGQGWSLTWRNRFELSQEGAVTCRIDDVTATASIQGKEVTLQFGSATLRIDPSLRDAGVRGGEFTIIEQEVLRCTRSFPWESEELARFDDFDDLGVKKVTQCSRSHDLGSVRGWKIKAKVEVEATIESKVQGEQQRVSLRFFLPAQPAAAGGGKVNLQVDGSVVVRLKVTWDAPPPGFQLPLQRQLQTDRGERQDDCGHRFGLAEQSQAVGWAVLGGLALLGQAMSRR